MSIPASERIVSVSVNRIELEAEAPFVALRAALEREVPALDEKRVASLLRAGASWAELTREVSGPSGLLRFWSYDPTPVMRVGGADLPAAGYALGDYVTAARMFRHDPGTALYAPARLELHARGSRTVLAFDQPSSALRTFGNNKITQAAFELDRLLGDLLEDLGLPRPSVLRL
ncbi:hypothetical protein LLS1_12560 [Leifsonia sp. LS1]|uniref:hypothetical protein n=1 Tax=Leifsonia sp. LS1 TaxID=2828483 RepID=UPI001CFE7E1C|nr:hypothetical protein [Leifsonia sp. LS1]GIT79587.1 hypothetical protein LLS1_12560 [Leifsonia sp. LS1]